MSVDARRMNQAMANFSKLSHEKYKGFGHVAGFYEAMLNGLLLGYDTPEQVLERIEAKAKELEDEVNWSKGNYTLIPNQSEIDALAAAELLKFNKN